MLKALEKTIAKLKDNQAGWVDRRDAALHLGLAMERARAVLEAHKNEKDVDVRAAVQRALGILRDTENEEAGYAPPPLDLEELLEACHKPPKRVVTPLGDGFQIDVQLKNGRAQCVYVKLIRRQDGKELAHIFTYCGENSEKIQQWALECNQKLERCAFALEKEAEGGRMMVVENQPMEEAMPRSVKAAVKHVAHYGDWLESKLSDDDVF